MDGSEEHRAEYEGRDYWFCSAGCKESFWNDPLRYLKPKRGESASAEVVNSDVVCGMEGSPDHAAHHGGREYRFCSAGCQQQFVSAPERYLADAKPEENLSPWRLRTWYEITQKFIGDVQMLRNELLAGYLIAGFAEALVPYQWFSNALHQIGQVPVIGYVLLLFLGLAIAVATFVCSMGNVPVAQFLKVAGVPLGANTAYIYGDLLILPLVQIYRKSFAPKLTAAFLGLFVIGAVIAGGLMELLISHLPGSL